MHEIHNHPVSCALRWNLRLTWQFTVYKGENFARTCTSLKALPLLSLPEVQKCSIFKQIHSSKSLSRSYQSPKFEIIGILFRYTNNSSELCSRETLNANIFSVSVHNIARFLHIDKRFMSHIRI